MFILYLIYKIRYIFLFIEYINIYISVVKEYMLFLEFPSSCSGTFLTTDAEGWCNVLNVCVAQKSYVEILTQVIKRALGR